MPRRTIADNVQTQLSQVGMTQEQLAEAVGKTQPTISRWLSGQFGWPSDELLRVAHVLGVDVTVLYAGVEPATPAPGDASALAESA